MATEEGLTNTIGCLSVVFPQFLAKEIARVTDEIVSAAQAVTDPLAAMADTNVQGLVDDVASLSEGSVVDGLSSAAGGLAGSYVARELKDRLEAMALANPGAIKKIQQSQNVGEQVLSGAMLLFSLFNEAPYVAVQRMCEKIINLTNLKAEQLQCLKKHIIQMNNSVAALAKARNEIVDFSDNLSRVSLELDSAQRELSIGVFTNADGSFGFDENAIARAVIDLKQADAILSPVKSELNLLDVANILTSGTTSASHITESNITLAAMVLPHLSFLLEAEMAAVVSVTDAINFNLSGIAGVLTNFSSVSTASRVGEIRARTIRELREKVRLVKANIDAVLDTDDTRLQTQYSLLWSSQINAVVATANKVQSPSFGAGSSEGPTKAQELSDAFDTLIAEINSIDSDNVVNGVDNVFDLKVLVTNVRLSGNRLLKLLDERQLTDAELLNFTVLVAQTATGGTNRIDESISAAQNLAAACETFLEVDIGFRDDYDNLINVFETLGFDRARDLLDSGRFDDLFGSSVDHLSYLTTAISCLTDAINGVDDIGTRNEIATLRDELQSQRSNQLLAAADNLNFGGSKILNQARAELERLERKKATALNIADKVQTLLTSLTGNLADLSSGFDEMQGNLERLDVDANGRLSADLDEFIRRPRSGVPICL